jgi:hypothetical protein
MFYVTTFLRIKFLCRRRKSALMRNVVKNGLRELPKKATKEQPWQNSSLGMKFVPIAGKQVLFSIWDTRLEDFHAFVESAGYDATQGMYSIGKDGWKRRGATWKEPSLGLNKAQRIL